MLLVGDWLITLPYIILGSACYIDPVNLTAPANQVSVTVSLIGSVFRACYVFICGWIYHMGRSHARRSFSGLRGYFMLVLLTSISLVVTIYKVMLGFNHILISYLCKSNTLTTTNQTALIENTRITSIYEEEGFADLICIWFLLLTLTALPFAMLQCCIWWLGACLWSCLYYKCILPLYVNSVHV